MRQEKKRKCWAADAAATCSFLLFSGGEALSQITPIFLQHISFFSKYINQKFSCAEALSWKYAECFEINQIKYLCGTSVRKYDSAGQLRNQKQVRSYYRSEEDTKQIRWQQMRPLNGREHQCKQSRRQDNSIIFSPSSLPSLPSLLYLSHLSLPHCS